MSPPLRCCKSQLCRRRSQKWRHERTTTRLHQRERFQRGISNTCSSLSMMYKFLLRIRCSLKRSRGFLRRGQRHKGRFRLHTRDSRRNRCRASRRPYRCHPGTYQRGRKYKCTMTSPQSQHCMSRCRRPYSQLPHRGLRPMTPRPLGTCLRGKRYMWTRLSPRSLSCIFRRRR